MAVRGGQIRAGLAVPASFTATETVPCGGNFGSGHHDDDCAWWRLADPRCRTLSTRTRKTSSWGRAVGGCSSGRRSQRRKATSRGHSGVGLVGRSGRGCLAASRCAVAKERGGRRAWMLAFFSVVVLAKDVGGPGSHGSVIFLRSMSAHHTSLE